LIIENAKHPFYHRQHDDLIGVIIVLL